MSKAYIKVQRLPDAPPPTKPFSLPDYHRRGIASSFTEEFKAKERMQKVHWTEESESELIMLYKRGLTYTEIAEAMEMPEGVIRHHIRVLQSSGAIPERGRGGKRK